MSWQVCLAIYAQFSVSSTQNKKTIMVAKDTLCTV